MKKVCNRMSSTHKCIGWVLLVFLYGKVSAQTIITDRPDQTESSSTIEKGSLQIESGLLMGFNGEGVHSERQFLGPTTLFRLGLTPGFELRLLNQYESIKNLSTNVSASGISDIEMGFKAQLLKKEDVNTEIAFLSHLIVPVGSDVLSNGNYGTINKLSISHQLSENIGMGYNLGYNNYGYGSGDLTYSLAFGFGLSDKVSVYIEPYGEWIDFGTYESNIDAGVTYLLKDNFQLDYSFGTGINHDMNYISVGFSWILRD